MQKNHGRSYQCGMVVTSPTSLLQHLSTLSSHFHFSSSTWRRRVLRGEISVNHEITVDPQSPLPPMALVHYHRAPWYEPILSSPLIELYRDEHLLAIHKPSGLPTMPSASFIEYTTLHLLRSTMPDASAPPQPVHRLGVGTSGVLLVATSLQSRQSLSAAIRERRVKKIYRALVCGANIPNYLRIDCPIGPVPFPIGGGSLHAACPLPTANLVKFSTNAASAVIKPMGKPSLSLVRVVRRDWKEDTAVVEVEIPTGRPHQIRIHMAYCGHPLVGDPLYLSGGMPDCVPRMFPKQRCEGEEEEEEEEKEKEEEEEEEEEETADSNGSSGYTLRVPLPRDCGYSLHAHQITFEHPTIEGKWIHIVAPPPENLK